MKENRVMLCNEKSVNTESADHPCEKEPWVSPELKEYSRAKYLIQSGPTLDEGEGFNYHPS